MTRDFTEKDIAFLIEKGNIKLIEEDGVRCQIGEHSFYFEKDDSDEVSLKEYLDTHSIDEIAEHIYDTIKDEETADNCGIYESEYKYYAWTILHLLKMYSDDFRFTVFYYHREEEYLTRSELTALVEYAVSENTKMPENVKKIFDLHFSDGCIPGQNLEDAAKRSGISYQGKSRDLKNIS